MEKTKKLTRSALLTALALGLSYMERFLPLELLIPLPGVKPGLANVVTLVALFRLGTAETWGILLARCILGGVFGGLSGLAFSLTGGCLALLTMYFAKKLPALSVYGISVLGSAAHNIGQILVAILRMGTCSVAAYLPWLLLAGIVTGLATGALCAGVLRLIPKEADI